MNAILANSKTPYISNLIGLLVLLLGLSTFGLENGYSIIFTALFIISIYYIYNWNKCFYETEIKLFTLIFILYFIIHVFLVLIHQDSIRYLDGPSRFIFVLPILFLLLLQPIKIEYFWFSAPLASTLAISIALYSKMFLDMERVETTYISPLQFGHFSLLFAMINAAGIIWAKHQNRSSFFITLFITGVIFGLFASILSGSRGGWIGLPLLLLMLYKTFSTELDKKHLLLFFSATLTLIIIAYLIPQTNMQHRINLINYDLSEYYTNDNPNTSIGARLEMYKSGFMAFENSPIFGMGEKEFDNWLQIQIKEDKIHPIVAEFNSLHNQYVEELAKRGLIGLIALMSMMLYLLYFFYKKAKHTNPNIKSLGLAGSLVVICYLDFFLSLTFFLRNNATIVFLLLIVIIISCIITEERQTFKNSKA
jgi:O-antigen ligase